MKLGSGGRCFLGRRMLLGLSSAFYGWKVLMRKQFLKQVKANPRGMTRDTIIRRYVTKGKKAETRRGYRNECETSCRLSIVRDSVPLGVCDTHLEPRSNADTVKPYQEFASRRESNNRLRGWQKPRCDP